MSKWMKSLHWKQITHYAGLEYLLITTLVQQIFSSLTINYYKNPSYAGVWGKLMMPSEGPPPMQFFVVSILFNYATGCTLAALFDFIHPLFGKKFWPKVIGFTDITVGLSIVFGYFPMILLFNLPFELLGWWFLVTFISIFFSTFFFAKTFR